MRRQLFRLLSIVSLLFLVLTCAVWIDSWRFEERFERWPAEGPAANWDTKVWIQCGMLFGESTYSPGFEAPMTELQLVRSEISAADRDMLNADEHIAIFRFITKFPTLPFRLGESCGFEMSLLYPTLLFAVAPGFGLFRTIRRRGQRIGSRCEGCGYDLRATPTRCPECGRDVQ